MDNGASSYRRFLSGDKAALVDIISEYREGLVLYINSLLNDFCTAEEIAEEVFIKLYVGKPKFSEKCTFRTWLYTIGRNTAIDHIRKSSKVKEKSIDDFYDLADKDNIETSYIKDEDKKVLYKALEQLSDEYRQVLHLVYFEGFTNTETAIIMRKSERQIRNLLYRSKGALKKILGKEGVSYEQL